MGGAYRTQPIRIDSGTPAEYLMISVAIGMREGSYPLTPEAVLDDGLFEVLEVGALRRWDVFRYFPRMCRGDIPKNDPRIRTLRTPKLALESNGIIPFHIDGEDPWRKIPQPKGADFRIEFEVLPSAIAVELFGDRRSN